MNLKLERKLTFIVTAQGYYENPEATKEALDEEGFFKTGDVGFVDEDGILHLIDRKKDIFKYFMHHVNSVLKPSELF